MTLKEECEDIWKNRPLAFPCHLAGWLDQRTRIALNMGFYPSIEGLTPIKGKLTYPKSIRIKIVR
jgi:hypothetical protein